MRAKLLALGLVVCMNSNAHAETTLGRWCWKPVPTMPNLNGILTIKIADDGQPYLESKYGDGSSGKIVLEELSATHYTNPNSKHGDSYRIIKTDGSLQLIDNDGIGGVARRLENSPVESECGF